MAIQYQLGNGNNWSLFWTGSFTASNAPGSGERYYPLPEVIVPLLLDRHVIAVYCHSTAAPPHWRLGGLMNVRLRTGILTGSVGETYPHERKRVWLNRLTLFTLPKLSDEYEITFDVPYWHRQMTISVYEYTGPIVDTTDQKLDQILQELQT